jgi:sec-independent protein translocase protein TatA
MNVMNLFVIAGVIGAPEIIVIVVVVVLLFGGSKIPELMKGIGKGMRDFKKASSGEFDDEKKNPEKLEK